MFTGIGLIAFCCAFGAALIGFVVAPKLPDNLRLERISRSEQPDDRPPDQFEHVSHRTMHRPIRAPAPVGLNLG
jgi:hypothetical protein